MPNALPYTANFLIRLRCEDGKLRRHEPDSIVGTDRDALIREIAKGFPNSGWDGELDAVLILDERAGTIADVTEAALEEVIADHPDLIDAKWLSSAIWQHGIVAPESFEDDRQDAFDLGVGAYGAYGRAAA